MQWEFARRCKVPRVRFRSQIVDEGTRAPEAGSGGRKIRNVAIAAAKQPGGELTMEERLSNRPGQEIPMLWVGTYYGKCGRGLYPIHRSPSGEWTVGEPFNGAPNASFAAWSPRHRLFYLVDEQAGTLAAYRYIDGWLREAMEPTGGSQPCFIALDTGEARIAVANYGSGSIAMFSLDPETGLPDRPAELSRNSGSGPNPDRQEGPHAHCACFSPDQQWLYQVDLGTDEILAFKLEDGLGEPQCAFRAPPASGPRHLLFHPSGSSAFLVSELTSTVHLLAGGGGSFWPRQVLSTLPDGCDGDSLGGHIGMNAAGNRLYVTNRGHDSIAVFRFDTGRLRLIQHAPAGGKSPRHFLLLEDERLMLVANEEGGNVTGFHVAKDGTLRSASIDIRIPGPAILFGHH